MKTNNRFIGLLLCLVALCIAGCFGKKEEAPKEETPRLVKTYTVGEEKSVKYTYPGRVEPSEQAELSFEVPGLLTEVKVKASDRVDAGDVLARLDPRNFEIEISKAKADYDRAASDVERNRPLAEKDYISRSSFDRLIATRDMRKATLDAAEKRLADSHLVAPFKGIIADDPMDNFQNVQAKETVMLLHSLVTIEIALNLPSSDLVFRTKRTGDIIVTMEDLPGREFVAKLKSVSSIADPETQTFRVVLTMTPPDDARILPGMAATVTATSVVESEELDKKYISLPAGSVLADELGNPYVWLIDGDVMTVKRKKIKTGELTEGSILVLEGLNKGDTIVTAGGSYLADGMKVRIQQ